MSETTSAAPELGDDAPVDTDDEFNPLANQDSFGEAEAEEESDDLDSEDTDDDEEPEEKIKLKINGKTVEKSKAEVIELAQKYAATEIKLESAKREVAQAKKMQSEIAAQQEGVKQLMAVMARGDLETIANFVGEHLNAGDKFDEGVIAYALKKYEYGKLSPAEREAAENKKEIERYRRQMEDRQREDQERAQQYAINQASQHIASELPKAIASVGLPDTKFVRDHIVGAWRSAIERGQNPTASAVANYVKKQLEEAKMLVSPKPAAKPTVRPKATKESVGLADKNQSQQYERWDDMIAKRNIR